MPKVYGSAESVEHYAQVLIPTTHPELATARIRYVFADPGSKKNGKPVYGKARKISGIMEHLLDLDFLIEVGIDHWNELTEEQRTAVVDHLLERCTGEEDESAGGAMKWVLREPDVQEFSTVLHRQGAWHEDLDAFVSIAKRINLDEIAGEIDTEEVVQRT